jgi:hypothetical protein
VVILRFLGSRGIQALSPVGHAVNLRWNEVNKKQPQAKPVCDTSAVDRWVDVDPARIASRDLLIPIRKKFFLEQVSSFDSSFPAQVILSFS